MFKRYVIAVSLFALLPTAAAQTGREAAPVRGRGRVAPQQSTDNENRIFRIKYAEAEELAQLVSGALNVSVLADERTNSVIVTAPESRMEKVEALVAQIDTPVDESTAKDELTLATIRNRDVGLVLGRLRELFSRELRVSADEEGRHVILRGTRSNIDLAMKVIETMDQPLPTATVEVSFFQVGTSDEAFSQEIPDDLKPVARQLERFGTPRLVGRMSTAAVEGQTFTVEGQIAESTLVEMSGRLEAAPNDGTIRLSLSSNLTMRRESEATGRNNTESPRFLIKTNVATKRAEYLVLGSAPLGWRPGESVVLVVYVPASVK